MDNYVQLYHTVSQPQEFRIIQTVLTFGLVGQNEAWVADRYHSLSGELGHRSSASYRSLHRRSTPASATAVRAVNHRADIDVMERLERISQWHTNFTLSSQSGSTKVHSISVRCDMIKPIAKGADRGLCHTHRA